MQLPLMRKFKSAIQLMRTYQWVKNGLIFFPMFFAAKIDQPGLLLNAFFAFAGFSLVASGVYIFNDLHDVNEDRLHPLKKFRPLAASEITPAAASVLLLVLLCVGVFIMYFPFKNPLVLGLVFFYILQNLLYTLRLKHFAIVDTAIISIGFLIRILIGGIVTETILSQWIILMTFLLAMFLALAKRRDDVQIFIETNEKPRKNVDGYNLEFLNAAMMITASVVIVTYIMYTMSVCQTGMAGQTKNLYFTTFFVLIGILRFLHLIMVKKVIGGPTKILIRDPFLLILITGWLITFALLLY